jgi:hypothetical protein
VKAAVDGGVKAAGGCGWWLVAGSWRLRLVGGWLPSLTFWIEFKFQHFLHDSWVFHDVFHGPFYELQYLQRAYPT